MIGPARLGERFSATTLGLRKFGAEAAMRGLKAQRLPFAAPCELNSGFPGDHLSPFLNKGRLR